MPPLQPSSTLDLATTLPFADHTPSPFDKLLDTSTAHQYTQQTPTANTPPDISALFGRSAPAAQQPVMSSLVPLVPQDRCTPLQHRKSPMTAAPAPHQNGNSAAIKLTQHRHPSHNHTPTSHRTLSQSQSQLQEHRNQYPHQHHQQHHQQHNQQHYQQHDRQQYRHQQQFDPNQFNANGYSVINTDSSSPYDHDQTRSAIADTSMTVNASSGGFFSRSGTDDSDCTGLSTGRQGSFAPKLAKAASYVSSTLAVTSSFASEKLSTASTKIADLWQHNQNVLPQQQRQEQDNLYHHGNHCHSDAASTMIGTGGYQPLIDSYTSSYDGQAQLLNANHNSGSSSNYHYQSSCYNSNNSESETTICGTRNPLATSTLSNAASVAGSYLPSLSKLPALPTLRALPVLPTLPPLPWVNKDKNQLPQQQPWSEPHTYTNEYITPSEKVQGRAYHSQQQHPSYADEYSTHNNGYSPAGSIWTGTGAWWGGLRDEMQRGRRIVETGVQAGVAWWWDSDVKNPLGNVV